MEHLDNYLYEATKHPQRSKSYVNYMFNSNNNTVPNSVKHLEVSKIDYPELSSDKINVDDCMNHKSTPLSCNQENPMILNKIKEQEKKTNDLLLNKKKICGILQETIFYDGNKYIIIGIGINLVKNPIIKKYQITNILKETGIKIQILKLVKLIEKKYINKIKQFA